MVLTASMTVDAQRPRGAEVEQVRARQRISMMEGVLERAVLNGADLLLQQVDSAGPDALTLSSAPQVRGFPLEGYGVFFDVEVPALRPSFAWTMRAVQSQAVVVSNSLADLRAIRGQIGDPEERARVDRLIAQLEATMQAQRPQRTMAGAARGGLGAAALAPPAAQARGAATQAALDNPNEIWTNEVKAALVEAMLEHSGPLGVADQEWLIVAARDNMPRDLTVPGGTVDFSTLLFRVKGSDLTALHAKRITMEEARKRVEVREY